MLLIENIFFFNFPPKYAFGISLFPHLIKAKNERENLENPLKQKDAQ